MSLYTMEEICCGCANAVWMRGVKREAFDYCEVNAEQAASGIDGSCPRRVQLRAAPTES